MLGFEVAALLAEDWIYKLAAPVRAKVKLTCLIHNLSAAVNPLHDPLGPLLSPPRLCTCGIRRYSSRCV
jgi:hypothetical protein